LAVLLVAVAGVVIRHPLSRIPENALKFAVGLLLSAFGTFWAGEGIGVNWPLSDLMLIALLGFFGLFSWFLVFMLHRYELRTNSGPSTVQETQHEPAA
jgi:uncharacterized membrane protein